jgi:hypothetical protein
MGVDPTGIARCSFCRFTARTCPCRSNHPLEQPIVREAYSTIVSWAHRATYGSKPNRLRQARFTTYTQFTVTTPSELRRRLDGAHRQGWSCARGEIDEAITGISVPLRSIDLHIPAAIHISMNSERATPRLVECTIVPTLKRAAAAIAQSCARGTSADRTCRCEFCERTCPVWRPRGTLYTS